MTQIIDAELTENGLTELSAGRILLIACGALAREILDLKKANGWDHMDLTCLPAKLHLYPEKITEAVIESVAKHRASYDEIFVVYADCGTGGLLQTACDNMGVQMVAGPHCYSFEGNERFAGISESEFTAFTSLISWSASLRPSSSNRWAWTVTRTARHVFWEL